MSIQSQIEELLELLTQKGSRISETLLPGFTDKEVSAAESVAGFNFPEEFRAYLKYFGHGFRESVRAVDAEAMLDFSFMPFATCVKIREFYANTIVLGEDLFPGAAPIVAFPVMTSGAEFISLVWSKDVYAVVWKVNDYGYSSRVWPSLQALLEYVLECWRNDIYKFDFTKDEIDGDYVAAMELLQNYATRVGSDD